MAQVFNVANQSDISIPTMPIDFSSTVANPPIQLVVQVQERQSKNPQSILKLGVCALIEQNTERLHPTPHQPIDLDLWPINDLDNYFKSKSIHPEAISFGDASDAKIIQTSRHGQLSYKGDPIQKDHVIYIPNPEYLGKDEVVLSFNFKAQPVVVHYFIHVVDYPVYDSAYNNLDNPQDFYKQECGKKGGDKLPWKIATSNSSAAIHEA